MNNHNCMICDDILDSAGFMNQEAICDACSEALEYECDEADIAEELLELS